MNFPIEGPNHCTTLMVVKFYLNDEHLYCCAADSQSTLIKPDSSPVIARYCQKVFRLNRRLVALIGGNAVCADILLSALHNSCAIECRAQHFVSIALEGIDSKFQAVADSDFMGTRDQSKDYKMVTALIVDRMLDNLGVMRICVWLKSKENFRKVHIDCNFEKERFVAVGAGKIHRINFEIKDRDEAVERVFDAMDDECQTNQFSGGHCCVYSGGPSRDWFPQTRLINIGEKKELRHLQLEEPTASEKKRKRAAKKNQKRAAKRKQKRAAKRKQKRAAKRRKAQTGAENDLKGSLAPSIHCALYTSFGHHLKQASKLMEEAKRSLPVAGKVNVTPAEEKAIDEEPLVFANKLEAKNAFKSLLESVNVECDWTWEQATRVIINDKRYGALKTLGERMQAFNEYLGQRKKQEAEERHVRQKKAREEFTKMLELVPPGGHSLVVPTQWKQVDGIDHH